MLSQGNLKGRKESLVRTYHVGLEGEKISIVKEDSSRVTETFIKLVLLKERHFYILRNFGSL